MTATILTRASVDLTTSGRTLEGLAFKWDHPSLVRDATGPAYLEAFARNSTTKTIKERGTFPVMVMHRYDSLPVGAVSFLPSDEGLMFSAPLSATRDADEVLALVNDGAMRSVSVGFRAIANAERTSPQGRVTVRKEIALRELSVAPTGFGQHEGAEILAVRAEQEGTPRLDQLRKRKTLLVISW